MVLRRIKDRARVRLGLTVVEVGSHDLWQRAELGVATASADRGKLMELLDDAWRFIASSEGVEPLSQWREVTRFEGEPVGGDASGLVGREAGRDIGREAERDIGREAGREGVALGEMAEAGREGGRSGDSRGGDANGPDGDAQWTPPEWQRMLDEESR